MLRINSGRTAPEFRAEFLLLTQRLISICLLVVYGLPASIGPHWHHHGGCADCVSALNDGHCEDCTGHPLDQGESHDPHRSCDPPEPDDAELDDTEPDHSEQHDFVRNSELPSVGADQVSGGHDAFGLPAHSLRAEADHEACSVCQFYAQSPLVDAGFTIEACEAIVTQQSSRSVSVYSEPQLLFAVRGPPC